MIIPTIPSPIGQTRCQKRNYIFSPWCNTVCPTLTSHLEKNSKTWSMRELSGDDHSSFEIDKIASLCYIHFVWHCLEVRFFELWRRWLLVCLTRVIGYTFDNLKLWLKQLRRMFWREESWKIRVHDEIIGVCDNLSHLIANKSFDNHSIQSPICLSF